MKLTFTRAAVATLLLAAAAQFPTSASAISFHTPLQSQSILSNALNETVVFDPFGYQEFRSGAIFGSYDYSFQHRYTNTLYSHWVYDYYMQKWVFLLETELFNFH